MELRQLTEAEIAAANLRRMARDLILEAERLEAAAGIPRAVSSNRKGRETYTCPMTGEKIKVKSGRLPD